MDAEAACEPMLVISMIRRILQKRCKWRLRALQLCRRFHRKARQIDTLCFSWFTYLRDALSDASARGGCRPKTIFVGVIEQTSTTVLGAVYSFCSGLCVVGGYRYGRGKKVIGSLLLGLYSYRTGAPA
jgi:hypothetical protein